MHVLRDEAQLTPEQRERLGHRIEQLATLEEVIAWGCAQPAGGDIVAIVVQDEYTHDVVMDWESGLHLVFDTT